MPKTTFKPIFLFFCQLLFLIPKMGIAQDIESSESLISFIQKLEKDFVIKFSYVDEDIRSFRIKAPKKQALDDILQDIQEQTQIQIQKLNERYYTLAISSTVDICAIVLDNFEKNTVTGATVEVLGSEIAVITDLDGHFSLTNIPRNAKLQIKHLGYKTQFISAYELLNKVPCGTILLGQFYQQLDEVIVYKFLTTGMSKQTDASIQIDTDDFGILPGTIEPDVLQTIQALPGIKSIDETVSDINIRGGSNDQNLILWDGIKMYQSGHFFGLISAFNPYLTDKVTLIKNGTSSQYGGGVSGLIDMHTKDNIKDAFFGGAGFNLISGDSYIQFPINEKLAFQFSARRSMTDFFNSPTYQRFFTRVFEDGQVTQNSNFYFYDFTGKLMYDINEKQKVRFSFININNLLDYSQGEIDNSNKTQSALDQTNLSLGGSLTSSWSDRFSTHLNAYYTRYNLDSRNISENTLQKLIQNNKVLETSIKLNSTFQLNTNLLWLNGYQFTETGITNKTEVTLPFFTNDVKDIARAHVFFTEFDYRSLNQKLYARGGVRMNYLQNPGTFNEFIIEPRLNINYALTKELKISSLGEFKSQVTNQVVDLEQNFLGIEKRRWVISDGQNLPITKSKQVSLGLNYDHENMYIGLDGFYKEVDGISTNTQGFQNQNQFDGEIGQYTVKGVEFLINKKTTKYSIWASYSYNLNNYTFKDVVPVNFPNNLDIRHTATFAGTYTAGKLKIGIGLNYHTGRPFTEPTDTNSIDDTFFQEKINYKVPNSSRLPEYLRADASAVYDFDISSGIEASVGASVLNFTNRKNILNTYYRLNQDNEIETIKSVSLGLTPNFSFRLRF